MPTRSWCIAALALLPIAPASASDSQVSTYRPDAEGYPCSRREPLAIKATEAGFAIAARSIAETEAAPMRSRATIALGASLNIDKALIERQGKEADHAPHP